MCVAAPGGHEPTSGADRPRDRLFREAAGGTAESESPAYRSEPDIDCADQELLIGKSSEQDVSHPSEP